jgi:hypothetical protein
MMHLFEVGQYGELLIVAERVVSVQAELEIERGSGAVKLYDDGAGQKRPRVIGSLIGLDNGVTIPVPQSPTVIGLAMSEAVTRRTVMPS